MGKQSRADVTGEEEPSGVFTVVINGRPWKTGSSNEMFALAGRIANKHSDKKVAVKWPTGQMNTVKAQGVAEAETDSDGYSVDHADSGEYDYEGDQARDQMNTIVRAARRLDGLLDDNENMPEWVQMKVTLAADYLDTAADYIESNQEPELDEGDRGRGRPPLGQQDTTPITLGRVEKTATGIRHHADPSRYGGTEPDAEDDHLMSKSHISRLGKITEPELDEGNKKPEQPEADYGDDYQDMVKRLKQLAGAGPLKTVYDPTKRVYRNVPVAVQPKK